MISFIHAGNESMASYRYRTKIPAEILGWKINDFSAETLIFSKPQPAELYAMYKKEVVVDFCDDHFDWPHYIEFAERADLITCPTTSMRERIWDVCQKDARVIPDPYEYPLEAPHCNGYNLLWFGHGSNIKSLQRVMEDLEGYPLRIVSNIDGAIPWSTETMLEEFKHADIVVLPKTSPLKSPNRAVESIRQGCCVVTDMDLGIPGLVVGDIQKGVEWAAQNCQEANELTKLAQADIERFTPQTVAGVWKTVMKELSSTSDVGMSAGRIGETSIRAVAA